MIEEDFLAIVKLVSGEEVLSLVCACHEDDQILLILDNPIIMKEYETPLGVLIKIQPWIKYSGESLHFIYIDKVITISEVHDEKIKSLYENYILQLNMSSTVKPSKSMGYISNVEDFRRSLEKSYKNL